MIVNVLSHQMEKKKNLTCNRRLQPQNKSPLSWGHSLGGTRNYTGSFLLTGSGSDPGRNSQEKQAANETLDCCNERDVGLTPRTSGSFSWCRRWLPATEDESMDKSMLHLLLGSCWLPVSFQVQAEVLVINYGVLGDVATQRPQNLKHHGSIFLWSLWAVKELP